MAKTKIQVGYGTGQRGRGKPYHYAGRRTGRKSMNGGFANNPTVSFPTMTDEEWDRLMGKLNESGETKK